MKLRLLNCLLVLLAASASAQSNQDVPENSAPYKAYSSLVLAKIAPPVNKTSEFHRKPLLTRYEFAVITLRIQENAQRLLRNGGKINVKNRRAITLLSKEFKKEIILMQPTKQGKEL